jgi:hypothetical protein
MRTAALAAAAANDILVESCVRLDDVLDDVGISAGAAAREMNDLRNAVGETAAVDSRLAGETNDLRDALAESAGAASALAGRMNDLRDAVAENTGAVAALANRVNDLRDSFITAAAAAKLLGDRSALSGGEAAVAASRFRLLGTGIRLTGTAIHWLIAGTAEFLAVFIPATVAVGAWAFAWTQGAQNIYQHMTSLFTATEALGQSAGHTMGEMLGLSGVWQKIQNEANSDVYQAMGAGLNILKESFGGLAQEGLRVGQIFDTFTAKLVYDFSSVGGAGKTVTGLLSDMTPDLIEIGQVFGNLGHALVNFASDMPGLAEGLLLFVDAVSKVILWVSRLPHYVVMGAMAFEEFNRWGSLAVTVLGKFGLATSEVSGGFFSLERAGGVIRNVFGIIPRLVGSASIALGTLVGRLAGVIPKAEQAGTAMVRFGGDLQTGAAGMSAGAALGIMAIAGAMGFLIYKALTAKSAAQQFAAALQSGIAKASNAQVIGLLAVDMGKLQAGTDQAAGSVKRLQGIMASGHAAGQYSTDLRSVGSAMAMNTQTAATYTAAQQQLQHQTANVATGAAYLASTYHTSLIGAMELATTAGVHLVQGITGTGQAAAVARLQIADLVQGYRAMGTPVGLVGKYMDAMAIQAGLAGTQMSKVSQAFDQLVQNITGGTASLGSMVESIHNIGAVTQSANGKLGEFGGQLSLTMSQSAKAMQGFGQVGSQVWQNFDSTLNGSDEQLADWVRTAQAMGTITKGQMTTAFRGMVAQLLPFTSHSRAAVEELSQLAQEAGGPATDSFKKLKDWVDAGAHSSSDMSKAIQDATIKMGNMAQVAQNLGNVLNNDIVNAMGTAEFKTSGVAAATLKYTQMLRDNTQNTAAGRSERAQLIHDFELAGESAQHARQLVRLLQAQIDAMHGKTVNIGVDTNYYTTGAGRSGLGFPGTGPGGHGGPTGGPVTVVHQHIAGSVLSQLQLGRAYQTAGLQKTFRNGGTQTYLPGRLH